MNVVYEISLETVNRGKKKFLVSLDEKKGKYFAHEVGKLTEISQVLKKENRYAHRLNPTKKFGNQYGRFWRTVGLNTIIEAKKIIYDRAKTHVQYC